MYAEWIRISRCAQPRRKRSSCSRNSKSKSTTSHLTTRSRTSTSSRTLSKTATCSTISTTARTSTKTLRGQTYERRRKGLLGHRTQPCWSVTRLQRTLTISIRVSRTSRAATTRCRMARVTTQSSTWVNSKTTRTTPARKGASVKARTTLWMSVQSASSALGLTSGQEGARVQA